MASFIMKQMMGSQLDKVKGMLEAYLNCERGGEE